MIELIIFDSDGVLVEATNIQVEALNEALGEDQAITWNEHLSTYDGLKTVQKLDMLSDKKGLPENEHTKIWCTKQQITLQKLKELKQDEKLKTIMSDSVMNGHKIAVCSNSISKTC